MRRPFVTATFAPLALVLVAACGANQATTGGPGPGPGGSGSTPSPPGGETSSYSTEVRDGIATYYDADGASAWNCGFDVGEGSIDVVALNDPAYAESAACGGCILVTGPKGSVTVRVVDRCPECEEHHLDLSEQAFAKIAEPRDGRVAITYQGTTCEVTGNVAFRFKEGSSQWWTAVQIRNHKLPIAKVEYAKDGSFVAMSRAQYNYFIEADGVGEQPAGLTLRVTAVDGQVIEHTIAEGVQEGRVFDGPAQFR